MSKQRWLCCRAKHSSMLLPCWLCWFLLPIPWVFHVLYRHKKKTHLKNTFIHSARKRALTNSLCSNITCLNGGECYAGEIGAQCSCPKPYFGQRCEQSKTIAILIIDDMVNFFHWKHQFVLVVNRPRSCNPNPCINNGKCVSTDHGYQCVCETGTTGVLCEQMLMPKDYRWCPLDCRAGTTCVYEGTIPKCRVL